MMIDICPACEKKSLCDLTPSHAYNNFIWHSCIIKQSVVAGMFFKRPHVASYVCDICRNRKEERHYRTINGVHICWNCYGIKGGSIPDN